MGKHIAVFITVLLISAFMLSGATAFGQATSEDVEERRQELEEELQELEEEIATQRKFLEDKQQERKSLERDVSILDGQIHQSELSIRARELSIQKINSDISGKENTIDELSEKFQREKESLAQLLRKTHELDSFSIVEVVLANEDLSEFFVDLDSFRSVKISLQDSFDEIRETKDVTATQRDLLEEKKIEESQLRDLQELQKSRIEQQRAQRNTILEVTKGEEAVYQNIVNAKERDAATIRAELFQLRGTAAIPFGEALDLANKASAQTGVRPALILGVIAEESNLGENVGTGNWQSDMHPTRDQPVFLEITKRLGLNPDLLPVSAKPWYGWGGAMGPAQFIPSTWVLYEDEIASLTGHNPPNPWDPGDAFVAAGVLLRDNGATAGTYAAERLAALRYFAGWKNAEKPSYAFYGDDVMSLAAEYQSQINILARN